MKRMRINNEFCCLNSIVLITSKHFGLRIHSVGVTLVDVDCKPPIFTNNLRGAFPTRSSDFRLIFVNIFSKHIFYKTVFPGFVPFLLELSIILVRARVITLRWRKSCRWEISWGFSLAEKELVEIFACTRDRSIYDLCGIYISIHEIRKYFFGEQFLCNGSPP